MSSGACELDFQMISASFPSGPGLVRRGSVCLPHSVNLAPSLCGSRVEDLLPDFERIRVLLHSDGTLHWEPGGIFRTTCDIDIAYFPMDSQHCSLIIGMSLANALLGQQLTPENAGVRAVLLCRDECMQTFSLQCYTRRVHCEPISDSDNFAA